MYHSKLEEYHHIDGNRRLLAITHTPARPDNLQLEAQMALEAAQLYLQLINPPPQTGPQPEPPD